jgi:hypothetical protein
VNGIANYLLASNIQDYAQWLALIGGLGLVVVAVKQPDGVAGFNIAMVRELKASRQLRRTAAQIVDAPKSQRPTTAVSSALKASPDTTAVGSE